MSEILQAEIVAYSSPKEIFVNGLSQILHLPDTVGRNLIDRTLHALKSPARQGFQGRPVVEKLRMPVQRSGSREVRCARRGRDCAILESAMSADAQKTFYLEVFGCQMNVHDSEKVIGTLLAEGYRQVSTVEEAGLILYNTCSIRDKAEQKVFHRLADYKKLQKQGKRFGVLGCVAQQEGEKIFERAPHVSLVCGSASYRNLPQMLVQLEAGNQRVTGLDDRETDECFETEFTARTNPHRGYITIIEGCDKFCAYCVVPFTRGKERSRTSDSVLAEARQMADLGYTEIQLLGQNVNSYKDPSGKKTFAELLAAVGEIPGIRRVRFTTSHPRDFGRDIVEAIDAVPTLCDHVHLPVQSGSDPRARRHAAPLHPRAVSGAHRLDQGGPAGNQHHVPT